MPDLLKTQRKDAKNAKVFLFGRTTGFSSRPLRLCVENSYQSGRGEFAYRLAVFQRRRRVGDDFVVLAEARDDLQHLRADDAGLDLDLARLAAAHHPQVAV